VFAAAAAAAAAAVNQHAQPLAPLHPLSRPCISRHLGPQQLLMSLLLQAEWLRPA
jgi:hypothetical protein